MHRPERPADSETSVQVTPRADPPRWKIAVVTWLGIFPSVVVLVCIVGVVIPPKEFLLWGNIVVTLLATVVMTYVVMPALTKLLARCLAA